MKLFKLCAVAFESNCCSSEQNIYRILKQSNTYSHYRI